MPPRRLALIPAAALGLVGSVPASAQTATVPVLATFTVDKAQGELFVGLYGSKAAYDAKDGPAAAQRRVRVDGRSVPVDFGLVPPGRYAIKVFQDLNGNGKVDFSPLGVPTEPYGFSNNARGAFGPAKWADAAFDVPGAPQAIAVRYTFRK